MVIKLPKNQGTSLGPQIRDLDPIPTLSFGVKNLEDLMFEYDILVTRYLFALILQSHISGMYDVGWILVIQATSRIKVPKWVFRFLKHTSYIYIYVLYVRYFYLYT